MISPNCLKINGFAVEMTLRGRDHGRWKARCLIPPSELGNPHRTRVPTFPQQSATAAVSFEDFAKAAKIKASFRFLCRTQKRTGVAHFPCGRYRGEKKMSTIPADSSEPNGTPQKALARPAKQLSAEHSVDKFADAQRAKKKQKRARHRAKLRTSHTSG
jgi:hypothetical protein